MGYFHRLLEQRIHTIQKSEPEPKKGFARILKEWDEEAHPRDETGRFSGGGGSGWRGSEKFTKNGPVKDARSYPKSSPGRTEGGAWKPPEGPQTKAPAGTEWKRTGQFSWSAEPKDSPVVHTGDGKYSSGSYTSSNRATAESYSKFTPEKDVANAEGARSSRDHGAAAQYHLEQAAKHGTGSPEQEAHVAAAGFHGRAERAYREAETHYKRLGGRPQAPVGSPGSISASQAAWDEAHQFSKEAHAASKRAHAKKR